MTRISSFAAHANYTSAIMQLQQRMYESNLQVSTEKKSASYAGYGSQTDRLINLENELTATDRWMVNNQLVEARLGATETTLEAIDNTIRDFRERLKEFGAGTRGGATEVEDIQRWAFHALSEMESFLNASIDNQYTFAGGKVTQPPVDLGYDTWDDFKANFDGSVTTYPTDRDTHVAQYYRGDSLETNHQLDADQTLSFGVTAAHPGFEKAMRAMGIIAQGDYGTAGGLENNTNRVDEAIWLLNDALESPAAGTPPFGAEESGDIKSVRRLATMNRVILTEKIDSQKLYANYLTSRAAEIENVDPNEATMRLLADSRALEVSYAALGEIRGLSLVSYLK